MVDLDAVRALIIRLRAGYPPTLQERQFIADLLESEPTCTLYRVRYVPDLGYVLYRSAGDVWDEDDVARKHKVAVFVDEAEAKFYAGIRNRMTEANGSDALP